MASNQLPEGVGKKIVEALKRQAEADIAPSNELNNENVNSVPLTKIEDIAEINSNVLEEISVVNEDEIIEETPVVNLMENPAKVEEISNLNQISQPLQQNYYSAQIPQENYNKNISLHPTVIPIPANVAKLNNLINSLPVGVSKQTGAIIIKQTLEAMGISVNNVLKEAQAFQEALNGSTRECMIKIQECKTQILQLETTVQANQENIAHVNDIVSLFIIGDK